MGKTVFGMNKREVTEILRNKGINPTTQRVEIAHLLLREPQHLSADEIFHKLNEEYEQVSQATVYNTLRLFVEKNVIRELIFSPDRIYYDSNTTPHHHFIDLDTCRILDLPSDAVKYNPEVKGLEADIVDISLIIRGRMRTAAARA